MSTKKKKRQIASENWSIFTNMILPELKKKYMVLPMQWHYKIITESNKVYNYYPKGERLNVQYPHNYYWIPGTVSLQEFRLKFITKTVK